MAARQRLAFGHMLLSEPSVRDHTQSMATSINIQHPADFFFAFSPIEERFHKSETVF